MGNKAKANLELERGQKLDPQDPTPWLYSAIQRKQENRYNEAVDDLERSMDLNNNRRVYRSRFLLDQDKAVRGTNLASIYLNEGMTEQSVREAVRAVNSDYSSSAAHLFLSNSYTALSDTSRVQLRYETGAYNELLVANLLSPVGGGSLSQFVSQQEYSKMFEKDGVGVSSVFEYRGDGRVSEGASVFGASGNFAYALDANYQFSRGTRLNNKFSLLEYTGTFKLQLSPADSLLLLVQLGDTRTGDVFQYYDPQSARSKTINAIEPDTGATVSKVVPNDSNLTYRSHVDQSPAAVLFGWHHEWSPGNHTLLLLGRLASEQEITAKQTTQYLISRDVGDNAPAGAFPFYADDGGVFPRFGAVRPLSGTGEVRNAGDGPFDFTYHSKVEIFSAELQQIATLGMQTFVFGGRYQSGRFDTTATLSNFGGDKFVSQYFQDPPSYQSESVSFERLNLYFYDTFRPTRWLSITGGISYDSMRYPDNFRNPPISGRQNSIENVSPKVGFILQPWRGATIRGAYTEALGGTSYDESVRLEPTQVAGFLQSYRSITSESLIGAVAGSKFRLSGLSLEQKLPTRTYLGLEFDRLTQIVDRNVGSFDLISANNEVLGIVPSSVAVKDRYHEDSLIASVNQLLGNHWVLGARYRYTRSTLDHDIPELSTATGNAEDPSQVDTLARVARRDSSVLHNVNLYALYNHPSGFFARAEANWYRQKNDSVVSDGLLSTLDDQYVTQPVVRTRSQSATPSDFWQFNVLAGYRFHRNQCEISAGVLNLTDTDYRLNPLTPYEELPRGRTVVVRCKLTF